MAILGSVSQVLHRQGWSGEAADAAGWGMLDDACFLCSGTEAGEPSVIELALEIRHPPAEDAELVVRAQRMLQGRPSGTGLPAALTVALHANEDVLAAATATPGGSWADLRLPVARELLTGQALTVALLVPAGERQVAVSLVAVEGRPAVD